MKNLLILLLFIPYFGFSQIKISALTEATSLTASDNFIINQGNTTKRVLFSRFSWNADSVAAQIHDSLDNIDLSRLLTFGTTGQVPYMNVAGNNYLYTSNFRYISGRLDIGGATGNTMVGSSAGAAMDLGTDNTLMGYRAGMSINTTGSRNTYIGSNAGGLTTIGVNNTSIGSLSGYSNVTGSRNIFIGYLAGYNETGSDNLYIDVSNTSSPLIHGDFADNIVTVNGSLNVTNSSNLHDTLAYYATLDTIDYYTTLDSLSNYLTDVQIKSVIHDSIEAQTFVSLGTSGQIPFVNPTGSDLDYINDLEFTGDSLIIPDVVFKNGNHIWDKKTLNIHTTDNNVFVGYQAGKSLSGGLNNMFVGFQSGYNLTSSSLNMGIGYQSGYGITTGATENTLVGYQTGYSIISGDKNTYVGYQTGRNNTGSNNVLIGDMAGFTGDGSSNIFIGFNSGYSETGSNKLYIENSNSTTPLVWGDFANDSVRINGVLEITGNLVNESPHLPIYRITDTTIAATQNVWYKIGGFTQKFAPVGMSIAGDSIQITKAGHFNIDFTISFSGLNNEIWEIAVFKNNSIEQPSQLRYTSTSDVGNVICPVEVYSDGNDWFSFRIRNTTDGDDPTIKRFSAIIKSQHLE